MDIRILSIGTLSAHPLWNERTPVRTGHATTTLIQTGDSKIIVDPGLPPQAVQARLSERAGLTPQDITHVFLTSFNPENRRAIELFDQATWLISPTERETVGIPLAQSLAQLAQSKQDADDRGDELPEDEQLLMDMLTKDIQILQRIQPAEDTIVKSVDLFPLPGVSQGTCGLLISQPTTTTLICGDALPTIEHLQAGQILEGADRETAQASFQEAIEIADILIPGRDNITQNLLNASKQKPFT
ncbi:MAG: MBL fold metallo-hydrolase [Phycisphaerales bacterium]|nr:MBL fold metallo-hydrolase [Phycisphaerales bacterium]